MEWEFSPRRSENFTKKYRQIKYFSQFTSLHLIRHYNTVCKSKQIQSQIKNYLRFDISKYFQTFQAFTGEVFLVSVITIFFIPY